MLSGAALPGDLFDLGSLEGVGGLKTCESFTIKGSVPPSNEFP